MGWRRSLSLALVVVVTVVSCSAVRAEEQLRRDTNLHRVPTRANLFARTRLEHQQSSGHEYHDPGNAEDDTQMNYDYFIQPIPKTRQPIPLTVPQRTVSRDSNLRDSLGRVSDITDKSFSTRRTQNTPLERQNYESLRRVSATTDIGFGGRTSQTTPVKRQNYENVNLRDSTRMIADTNDDFSVRRSQNAQLNSQSHENLRGTPFNPKSPEWEDQDPFSVFYDSMFPEMDSVIPEEETYSKNSASSSPVAPVKTPTGDITTVNPVRTVSPARSPPPVVSEARRPTFTGPDSSITTTAAKTQLPSSSNSVTSPAPPLMDSSAASKELDKLTTKMSVVLEKFGLSKAFTKKIFEEEVRFLESMMSVKPLREKLDVISHLRLNAVTPNIDFSHLFSKFGLKDVGSKIDLRVLASKLGIPDFLTQLNLTNIVSEFDIEDVARIVDLVEAAPNVSLRTVAEGVNVNFGHSKAAKILQKAVSQARRLTHMVDPGSLHRAAEKLGLSEDHLEEVFEKVEASARFVSHINADSADDDDGGKLLYLPIFESVSLNVVQTLGFTVLLLFLLLSAYSFVALRSGGLARKDPFKRARVPVPLPEIDWNMDDPEDWKTAVDAAEGHNLPWEQKQERENHSDQGQVIHANPLPDRPIPVPDPGALQWASKRPPGHVKPGGPHIKTRRGPLIVPVMNVRGGHRGNGPKSGEFQLNDHRREGEKVSRHHQHPQSRFQPPNEHQHQNQHHHVHQHHQKPQQHQDSHQYRQEHHQQPTQHHQFLQQHQPQEHRQEPYQHPNQHHQQQNHHPNQHHQQQNHHPDQHHQQNHQQNQAHQHQNQLHQHQNQHQPFLQPSVQHHTITHPRPYDPAHYDKHRHFASYEDDYEHEGKDEEPTDYLEEPYHHVVPNHFDSPDNEENLSPYNHWHSDPTQRPTDQEGLFTYYKAPSPNPPTRATRFSSIPTTWRPQRTNASPRLPSRTLPTTTTRSTTTTTTSATTTTPPTSPPPPPHVRPTSKYAQRVTSSGSEKKKKEKAELKTRRPKTSQEE